MVTTRWLAVREEEKGEQREIVSFEERIKVLLKKAIKETLCPYCQEDLQVGETSEGKTFGMGCSSCGMKVYLLVMTIQEGRRP